jgi:hypothetical protein
MHSWSEVRTWINLALPGLLTSVSSNRINLAFYPEILAALPPRSRVIPIILCPRKPKCVSPRCQGKGYSRELIEAVCDRAGSWDTVQSPSWPVAPFGWFSPARVERLSNQSKRRTHAPHPLAIETNRRNPTTRPTVWLASWITKHREYHLEKIHEKKSVVLQRANMTTSRLLPIDHHLRLSHFHQYIQAVL